MLRRSPSSTMFRVLALALFGCETFGESQQSSDAGAESGVPPAPPDAGSDTAEGGAVGDGSAAANLLGETGGFEQNSADCGNVESYHSDSQRVTPGRSSPHACRLCANALATTTGYTLDTNDLARDVKVGDRFAAEAWVRALEPNGQRSRIVIRTLNASGNETGDDETSAFVDVYIASNGGAGRCFDVDDIVARRLP